MRHSPLLLLLLRYCALYIPCGGKLAAVAPLLAPYKLPCQVMSWLHQGLCPVDTLQTSQTGSVIYQGTGTKHLSRGLQQVEQVRKLDAHGSVPYVAEALTRLREEVGNQSTVLGFVGAPFTLATYIVEGGSSKNYTHMKRLMFTQPEVLHAFLTKMADNVADYVRYQVKQAVHNFTC